VGWGENGLMIGGRMVYKSCRIGPNVTRTFLSGVLREQGFGTAGFRKAGGGKYERCRQCRDRFGTNKKRGTYRHVRLHAGIMG
jgi:hypothetical protein